MKRYMMIVNFDGGAVEDADGRVEAGGGRGPHGLLPRPQQGAPRDRRAGRGQALAGLDLAKIVTFDGLTAPVVTDGPFQEIKEWVAGYMIVDVESEERAIEIAARYSAVPGPGGVALAAADPRARDVSAEAVR